MRRRRPSPYQHPGQVLTDALLGIAIGVVVGLTLAFVHAAWKLGLIGG